ncbi:hypothetical protein R50912_20570 [Paenibacillus sp. FSL R5-0912]|nr:hypothetical protein R50912_20570 [Paenibacillus sp. FSL R5-0912]
MDCAKPIDSYLLRVKRASIRSLPIGCPLLYAMFKQKQPELYIIPEKIQLFPAAGAANPISRSFYREVQH